MPPSFDWPADKGRPLDFLLQVDFRDVAPHDSTGLFPCAGILTLFYNLKDQPWGYDPKDLGGYKVCFFPEGTGLEPRRPPDEEYALDVSAIRFWEAQSLPSFGSRGGARLYAELQTALGAKPDYAEFWDLRRNFPLTDAPTPDGPKHRLGGYSANIQGDMQLEAQLVMNGLYCGNSSGYRDPRAKGLEASCEEWTLLLQLDSDDAANIMWGDAGRLYYWIRRADLARCDFSKVWMTLQCY